MPTEHGDRCVASLELEAGAETVWRVLCAVDDWPSWNPIIEWTSAQIRNCEDHLFTVLSARTLLTAELRLVERERFFHFRCIHPKNPQPPAADFCVRVVPLTPEACILLGEACLEPWYRERLGRTLCSASSNVAMAMLRSLQRAVERPLALSPLFQLTPRAV
jgi:hypothetical protein